MSNTSEASNEFDLAVWVRFLVNSKHEEPAWFETVVIITIYIIILIGLVVNMLTCVVIYTDKTMHTTTNYYLFNLAVADIIVIFFFLIAVLVDFDYNNQWTCKLHVYFVVVLWNNSILTITILAIERYVAIRHPLKTESGSVWRRVCKVITCLWVLAILETLPELWSVDVVKLNGSVICSTIPTPMTRIINGLLALVTFVVPITIMIFVYVMIALKVNATQKYYTAGRVFNHRDNRAKINKLVALASAFLVCWLPYFILRVLIFALETNQLLGLVKWWSIGQRYIITSSFFSVVLNPLLYSLISTKFRESLAKMWMTKFRRNG